MYYIRYFADTSHTARSPLSRCALEYLKAMLALRPYVPIRLVSCTSTLDGAWEGCTSLLMTPMQGVLVNAVCCLPSAWTWLQRIPGRTRAEHDGEADVARCALWTAGARNVLFSPLMPLEAPEIATALQYDAIVVPDHGLAEQWRALGADPIVIATPVTDRAAFRGAVMP